jgi:hypothetical protein
MGLRVALLACGVLAAIALADDRACADTATLTEVDQDQIAESLLVYSQSHPATFLGANKIITGSLMVRGDDPSSDLLETLQRDGFGFKPDSEAKRGDDYTISIGAFASTSPVTATGELRAYNRNMGAVESYTVEKAGNRWTVDGYQLLRVVLVATPAAYLRAMPESNLLMLQGRSGVPSDHALRGTRNVLTGSEPLTPIRTGEPSKFAPHVASAALATKNIKCGCQ